VDAQAFKQAKINFEAATQLFPEHPEILDYLGATLKHLGEWERALICHHRALDIYQDMNNSIGAARVLANLGDLYNSREELTEALQHYKQALAVAEKTGDAEIYTDSLMGIGLIHSKRGNYQTAIATLHRVAERERELKNWRDLSTCYANIAVTYECMGDIERAQTYYGKTIQLSKKCGNRITEAAALRGLGNICCYERHDLDQALSYYQQAESLFRSIGNHEGLAATIRDIGWAFNSKGDLEQARNYLEEALKINEQLGRTYELARTLLGLAVVINRLQEWKGALNYYQQAEILFAELGEWKFIASCCLNMGNILWAQKAYEKAEIVYQRGYQAACNGGIEEIRAGYLMNLGLIYLEKEKYELALKNYEQAQKIFHICGNLGGFLQTMEGSGQVLDRIGQHEEADALYELVVKLRDLLSEEKTRAGVLMDFGIEIERQGDRKSAVAYYRRAISLFMKLEKWVDLARCQFRLGNALRFLEDLNGALTAYQQGYIAIRKINRGKITKWHCLGKNGSE